MKTTDLRIGNIVNAYKIGVCRVDGIESDILISTEIDESIPIGDVEGVPLTEQWLLDFGFEDEGGDDYVITKGENTLLLSVEKDSNKVFFVHLYWTHNSKYTFLKDILYVHQLQNLYFALTEENLILKGKNTMKTAGQVMDEINGMSDGDIMEVYKVREGFKTKFQSGWTPSPEDDLCHKCGGVMKFTGISKLSFPAQNEYKCEKCSYIEYRNEK